MAFTIGFIIPLSGCDPDWPYRGTSCRVVGDVLIDGHGLPDARVIFVPQTFRSRGVFVPCAFGKTDAQGKFSLSAAGGSKQIVMGRYHVIVSKPGKRSDFAIDESVVASGQQTVLDKFAKRMESQPEAEMLETLPGEDGWEGRQDETIPSRYNRNTELICDVQTVEAFLRPTFKLQR